ncbi:MAG: DUF3343 domain-containing protein [Syntrophotalea acetylenica]|jgi:hypothetical protein|uniref:Putative Se/S carrier protein-like domain-containing protein n=1 Tax=Syntrophotalea acetylenica TaxID=29542 RepID=A0A1L3GCW1_SYNAC|nr:DUF3343 domain-containing protein [Syntrophotalea acetylenica]APG23747.1 hypothetical protein A7E75_00945 [Syntrophotalea acetylenica]APG44328.1 hypothetical protein A6070_09555 [Syntrophotalea acetylenica]MDD4458111.1 DUF3343 domain-containing protein [Syntrophotalea acetylenica]MDY0263221.1 DUF3343 domain-containing protein [Syntrophotalea acetylenica]
MKKEGFYVLILPSIHHILKVEKGAKTQGIPVELIPTPRQISSDCGMAVEFHPDVLERLLAMVAGTGIPEWELYRREGGDYQTIKGYDETGSRV